jgi:hypothetical protein
MEKLREYINNNEDVKKYFIGDNNEDIFYNMVYNVAVVNHYKRNEPNLSEIQFEFIKITLDSIVESENFEDFIFSYIPKNITFYFK